MKKAEFNFQKYLISFLIVIGVLVTFGTFASNMGNKYNPISNVTVSADFQETYNELDEITSEVQSVEGQIQGSDFGDQDAQTTFLGGAISAVKVIFGSTGAVYRMIENMADTLGIDALWKTIAITIVTVLLLTSFLFMVFKSKG